MLQYSSTINLQYIEGAVAGTALTAYRKDNIKNSRMEKFETSLVRYFKISLEMFFFFPLSQQNAKCLSDSLNILHINNIYDWPYDHLTT